MRSCPNWLLLSLAISFASPLVLCAQSTDSERHQSHVRIETSGNGSDAARLFSQRLQALQGRALDWTKAAQEKTNPNLMESIRKDTVFTNVGMTAERTPWWDGQPPAASVFDWQGRPWKPGGAPAAHPNSRFTFPIGQYPMLSPKWDDPRGVPVSAILFGGRRSELVPLVCEALSWEHGVLMGAMMKVETTAAAEGAVGRLREDPMAMRPFCGYNMGDYFQHWLEFSRRSRNLPKIFQVNWFRKGKDGRFFRQNQRS